MGWRPNETDHDSAMIYCLSVCLLTPQNDCACFQFVPASALQLLCLQENIEIDRDALTTAQLRDALLASKSLE
jgi:hypothetical protein